VVIAGHAALSSDVCWSAHVAGSRWSILTRPGSLASGKVLACSRGSRLPESLCRALPHGGRDDGCHGHPGCPATGLTQGSPVAQVFKLCLSIAAARRYPRPLAGRSCRPGLSRGEHRGKPRPGDAGSVAPLSGSFLHKNTSPRGWSVCPLPWSESLQPLLPQGSREAGRINEEQRFWPRNEVFRFLEKNRFDWHDTCLGFSGSGVNRS
jgi:hypothetical protein